MDVPDDGLPCPPVGRWTEQKHSLVSLYAKLFSTGMKDKWDERVYIELYAGAGYSKVRDTGRIIAGSPVQAVSLEHPFDKYVFCEEDPQSLEALRTRIRRLAPSASSDFVLGDCNKQVDSILEKVPIGSRDHHVLSLCFVDPYDIGIKFETLRRLSNRYVDFLILLALYMDANRNYEHYIRDESSKVDQFLGSKEWRQKWEIAKWDAVRFPRFLAEQFTASMADLGYIAPPFYTMKEVKLQEKNLPLYHLALFSRHERAYQYWDQVLKYSTDQQSFWD